MVDVAQWEGRRAAVVVGKAAARVEEDYPVAQAAKQEATAGSMVVVQKEHI